MKNETRNLLKQMYYRVCRDYKNVQPRFVKPTSVEFAHGKFIKHNVLSIFDIDLHALDDIEEYFDDEQFMYRSNEIEHILINRLIYGPNVKPIKVNEDLELIDGWHRLFLKFFRFGLLV